MTGLWISPRCCAILKDLMLIHNLVILTGLWTFSSLFVTLLQSKHFLLHVPLNVILTGSHEFRLPPADHVILVPEKNQTPPDSLLRYADQPRQLIMGIDAEDVFLVVIVPVFAAAHELIAAQLPAFPDQAEHGPFYERYLCKLALRQGQK